MTKMASVTPRPNHKRREGEGISIKRSGSASRERGVLPGFPGGDTRATSVVSLNIRMCGIPPQRGEDFLVPAITYKLSQGGHCSNQSSDGERLPVGSPLQLFRNLADTSILPLNPPSSLLGPGAEGFENCRQLLQGELLRTQIPGMARLRQSCRDLFPRVDGAQVVEQGLPLLGKTALHEFQEFITFFPRPVRESGPHLERHQRRLHLRRGGEGSGRDCPR